MSVWYKGPCFKLKCTLHKPYGTLTWDYTIEGKIDLESFLGTVAAVIRAQMRSLRSAQYIDETSKKSIHTKTVLRSISGPFLGLRFFSPIFPSSWNQDKSLWRITTFRILMLPLNSSFIHCFSSWKPFLALWLCLVAILVLFRQQYFLQCLFCVLVVLFFCYCIHLLLFHF